MKYAWQQLADKYPLHFQRIAELHHEVFGRFAWFYEMPARDTPQLALANMFPWYSTSEGLEYWSALAEMRTPRRKPPTYKDQPWAYGEDGA